MNYCLLLLTFYVYVTNCDSYGWVTTLTRAKRSLSKQGLELPAQNIPPPNISKKSLVKESTGTRERTAPIKLRDDQNCKKDIVSLCNEDDVDNFSVLECIQGQERDDSALISEGCHNLLWNFKLNLTQSSKMENLARGICSQELQNFPDCVSEDNYKSHTISCMAQNLDKINDERCQKNIVRFAAVIFSDYHLIGNMAEDCKADIQRLSCGRIQQDNSPEPHSQGLTIECLSKHVGKLDKKCHSQILRLSELQSEDFHLDRAFYFDCRDDKEKFCKDIRAGKGRVYKCLLNHKRSRSMSPSCLKQLSRRQELVATDYKVSQGLAHSCRSAIMENQCRKGTAEESHDVKLSKILLCLEGAVRKGKIFEGNCLDEILAHRQMMMEDFKMSPDMMAACSKEMKKFCQDTPDSNTLHCLLKHANKRGKKKLSDHCARAMEDVIKESDPAEDWRADPVLREACLPVVQSRCRNIRGGEGRVMRCLMRQLSTHHMTQSCEVALLEIQYFVARDWKLDPQLYHSCYNESVKLCHAQLEWVSPPTDSRADSGILVLPCLFRYAYHPSPKLRLSRQCSADIHRVMQERAAYVDLHPQIEMACIEALATLCSENTEPGEEILCLQKNLDRLGDRCSEVVANYTKAEVKDIGLNNVVMTHCADILEQMCSHTLTNEENNGVDVMNCLIENKNSPVMKTNYKCKAVVEDFQIIMIKDVSFTPMFKQECYKDVQQHCSSAVNRKDVIECLSRKVLTDTLDDDRIKISKRCRQQLRKQITQKHENINLDPALKKACHEDVGRSCSNIIGGGGAILECLREQNDLLPACHELVFQRELEESADRLTDVVFMRKCKEMIKTFCPGVVADRLLLCLMKELQNPDFDSRCSTVVVPRMIEKGKDIRLNPHLYRACHEEISRFCGSEIYLNKGTESNGKVIECLKEELPKKTLGSNCVRKVVQITKMAALNYRMDPVLNEKCGNDITTLCHNTTLETIDEGEVEECLKKHLKEGTLQSVSCKNFIAQLTRVEHADINADPVLHRACSRDDALLCREMLQGAHLGCLYEALEKNPKELSEKCRSKLKERREMFKVALKFSKFGSFGELADSVNNSPQRNYFIISFITVIGVIFIGGLVCGRASRRYTLLKNR